MTVIYPSNRIQDVIAIAYKVNVSGKVLEALMSGLDVQFMGCNWVRSKCNRVPNK